jgi:hypothetical protein
MHMFLVRYEGYAVDLLELDDTEAAELRTFGVELMPVPNTWQLQLDWGSWQPSAPALS